MLSAQDDTLYLSDLVAIQSLQWLTQCNASFNEGLIAQPLLIPQRLDIARPHEWLAEYGIWLQKLGLRYNTHKNKQIIIQAVPALLRQTDMASTIPAMLSLLERYPVALSHQEWHSFIATWLKLPGLIPHHYSMDSARSLWLWLQQNVADWQNNTQLMRSVDLTNILEVFSRD